MQFTSALSSLSILALATAALEFGLLCIRSGSIYQYSAVSPKGDNLIVGSSHDYMVRLNDDGSVTNLDGSKYLNLNDKNQYVFGSEKVTGYHISEGHLTGPQGFIACPDADGTVFLSSKCDSEAGLGLALRAVGIKEIPSDELPSTTSSYSTSVVIPTSLLPSTIVTKRPTPTPPASTKDGKKARVSCNGCSVENAEIKFVESHPHVFSVGGSQGNAVEFNLRSDTTMVDGTGRGINVDGNTGEVGLVNPWGTEPATPEFSNNDGKLAFKGNTRFYSCPSGAESTSLSVKECIGGDAIELSLI